MTFPDILDIHVTASDIHWEWTEAQGWFTHPLAMAATRAIGGEHFALFRGRRIEVLTTHSLALRAAYSLSEDAMRFARRFVNGQTVVPATFTLTLTRTW